MGGSSIFAELDKFRNFSTGTGDSATTFMTAIKRPVSNMAAKMGMSGIAEGQCAMTFYRAVIEEFNQLMEDLPYGVSALSQGALTIGANYVAADLDSEAGMNVVTNTFNPKKGDSTTKEAAEKSAKDADTNPDNQTKDATLPDPTDMTPDNYETDNGTEAGEAYNDAHDHQIWDGEHGNGERNVWGEDPSRK